MTGTNKAHITKIGSKLDGFPFSRLVRRSLPPTLQRHLQGFDTAQLHLTGRFDLDPVLNVVFLGPLGPDTT